MITNLDLRMALPSALDVRSYFLPEFLRTISQSCRFWSSCCCRSRCRQLTDGEQAAK